jgi:hypothetical protein
MPKPTARPLPALQNGEIAGHVDTTFLADEMRLDRFHQEPVIVRESLQIRP